MRQQSKLNLDNFIEVEGLVLAAAWDDLGRPSAFKISSPGEHTYLVENDKAGRQLKHHLRQYVRVWGKIEEAGFEQSKIKIDRILQHE